MTRNFTVAAIIIPVLMWFAFFLVLQENFKVRQVFLDNLVYRQAIVASKNGVITRTSFDELFNSTKKMGGAEIYLKAIKHIEDEDFTEEGFQLIGRNLREEGFDELSIFLVMRKPHPMSALFRINMFMGATESSNEFIQSAICTLEIQ